MAQPYLFTTPADASLFQLPPAADPMPIPPPSHNTPFAIPDAWFTAALDPKVPITIATVYAVTAKALNAYNKSTNKRPWAISKTRAFRAFVVAHNIFLAVYSAWTWYGTLHTLRRSIVSPTGPNGWAGTMDSFCKFHGAAGLGNDVSYNQAAGLWQTDSAATLIDAATGLPSSDVSGRMWNEGLAFYGWIFYLSKFYEVLDTLIILAKGKYSSTLQTYHHAGAMMAMWAGIRYMSAPIWMFVFFNSFVHSLMYTYYTVTAFDIKVPQAIKRSLTTLQISQFVIGVFWATAHSFIAYTAPVQVPVAKPAASPAAGSSSTAVEYETQWRDTSCVTSAGSTFAIWVNVIYLLPLTYLFVSFFIASYLRRSNRASNPNKADQLNGAASRRKSTVEIAERAGRDAARDLEREVYRESGSPALTDSDSDANSKNGAAAVAATPKKTAAGKSKKASGKKN